MRPFQRRWDAQGFLGPPPQGRHMFAKIFSQIFDSSIADDWQVRVVFEDLLILADADGTLDMTPEAIAARTRVPLEIVSRAITKLEEPDNRSRSPDYDGRRLIRLNDHRDWGWTIVNYVRYREIRNKVDRKEYMRNYMREKRPSRSKERLTKVNTVVNLANQVNTSPSSSPSCTQEERGVGKGDAVSVHVVQAANPNGCIEEFSRFWEAYPLKQSRIEAERAFVEVKAWLFLPAILAAIQAQRTWDKWKRGFIPKPSNWLREMAWMDQPSDIARQKSIGELKAQITALDTEIANHPANSECVRNSKPGTLEQKQELKQLRLKRDTINSQLARA